MFEQLELGSVFFGCLVAGISAAASVYWLVGYLSKRGLGLFVWYRIFIDIDCGNLFWPFRVHGIVLQVLTPSQINLLYFSKSWDSQKKTIQATQSQTTRCESI